MNAVLLQPQKITHGLVTRQRSQGRPESLSNQPWVPAAHLIARNDQFVPARAILGQNGLHCAWLHLWLIAQYDQERLDIRGESFYTDFKRIQHFGMLKFWIVGANYIHWQFCQRRFDLFLCTANNHNQRVEASL